MVYIKYSGTIQGEKKIIEFEEEFTDISRISGWDYELVTENFQTLTSTSKKVVPRMEDITIPEEEDELLTLSSSDVYLKGMMITIDKNMAPLRFTFDKNGKMATISFCTTDTKGFNNKFTIKKYEFLYYPYIKIYSNNVENHIKVVKLLDYLKKSYIEDLEVIDTSFYWDNRDEEELKVRMWKANKDRKIIL